MRHTPQTLCLVRESLSPGRDLSYNPKLCEEGTRPLKMEMSHMSTCFAFEKGGERERERWRERETERRVERERQRKRFLKRFSFWQSFRHYLYYLLQFHVYLIGVKYQLLLGYKKESVLYPYRSNAYDLSYEHVIIIFYLIITDCVPWPQGCWNAI